MAAKHVFLSFVEEDLDLVKMFRGQAKNKKFDLSFDDYSVKVPFDSNDAGYIKGKIRAQITAASILICLIGTKTATSQWVEWEIGVAAGLDKRLLGVRLHSGKQNETTPTALTTHRAKIVNWNIDDIVAWIG